MYNDLLVSIILCVLFVCIIALVIIMLTCLDAANLVHSNEGLHAICSILDECFIEFIDCLCCIRRRDRVTPNINAVGPPQILPLPPPALVIVNPLDNITLGLECLTPDPETKEEPLFT